MQTLSHPDAEILIEEIDDRRRRVRVKLLNPRLYTPCGNCDTSYPIDLIQRILDLKGPAWLCDEIRRDEDPGYVLQKHLEMDLLAYVGPEDFARARILDFGCGSGASTVVLARMFPAASIVGVELVGDLLSVARRRAEHHGCTNVEFLESPGGAELPAGMGQFDFILLSAVYEHLLPRERQILMPTIWDVLRPGGCLFLNQTPNRLFPLEFHTTRLPLINYLPDQLALLAARRFSQRVAADESWESLLRRGIRGATISEIRHALPEGDGAAMILQPRRLGMRDRIDMWYSITDARRMRALKPLVKLTMKAVQLATGAALVPDLSLAFQKPL